MIPQQNLIFYFFYPAGAGLRLDLEQACEWRRVRVWVARVGEISYALCDGGSLASVGGEDAADTGDGGRTAVLGEAAALHQALHLVVTLALHRLV